MPGTADSEHPEHPEVGQLAGGQPGDRQPGPSRWSTRDLLGPLLIFAGAVLLAAAVALPTLFVAHLRQIPLSTDFTTVAPSMSPPGAAPTAGSATILDRCSLNSPAARTLQATLVRQQRVVAVRPADAHIVTLQAGTSVQADRIWLDGREVDSDAARAGSERKPADGEPACTDATLSAVMDRVTLNRDSALPDLGTSSTSSRRNSDVQYDSNRAPVPAPDRGGYTYLMPFGVSAADHEFFDAITRRTVPLTHTGETQVNGRSAAQFVAEVPDTDLDAIGSGVADGVPQTRITRPASWFGVDGDPARPLTATLHQSSRWELSVDTVTGTIVDQRITVEQTYRIAEEALASYRLTNLRATFRFDRQTRDEMTKLAKSEATPLVIWGRIVPLLAGLLGLVAVVGGIVVTAPHLLDGPRRRLANRRRRHAGNTAS